MGKREKYNKLKDSLERALLFEEDIENLDPGDMIFALPQGYNREVSFVGLVRKARKQGGGIRDIEEGREYMVFEWNRHYFAYDDDTSKLVDEYVPIANMGVFYKIRDQDSVNKIEEMEGVAWRSHDYYHIREGEIFDVIQREVEDTLEYRFVTMDQELPVELGQAGPERKLELCKRFEKVLENAVEKTNYKDAEQMLEMKMLYSFAQGCGVRSTKAKMEYEKKRRELGRVMRQLGLGED